MYNAEELQSRYQKDLGFIKRGLESCERAGVSHDYFVSRYLDEDRSVPINVEVDKMSRLVQREWSQTGRI
jgi:hypothetical protein